MENGKCCLLPTFETPDLMIRDQDINGELRNGLENLSLTSIFDRRGYSPLKTEGKEIESLIEY